MKGKRSRVTREKKFSPEVFGWPWKERKGGRKRKKEADKKRRMGTRVVTFPFEIRVCTYGFQNVERHK